ncbi:hypothetical protein [Kingella denitrificans]|nr:hypothetical protein [Kingella denitrificans]
MQAAFFSHAFRIRKSAESDTDNPNSVPILSALGAVCLKSKKQPAP